jgi:gamma-glutamyltranspeptidase / glutathione hydrolase
VTSDTPRSAPFASRHARSGMVCAVDHLAAEAGVATMRAGGNAVDAAIATSAVLAVTTQQMCGMGGDLFALVSVPGDATPLALNASGRAGSGADAGRLRAAGHREVPMFGDIAAVPVPGCVDGWCALSARLGRLPLAQVLEPAVALARDGFPASPLLARSAPSVADLPGAEDFRAATHPGAVVRRPAVARTLAAIGSDGRDAFYRGEFGDGLRTLGRRTGAADEYDETDLASVNADWVEPLSVEAWGRLIWTVPPNSQGYLTLAAAWIASGLPLPRDPDDPLWAHFTVEAARAASYDRVEVLHENAEGAALLADERLAARRALVSADRAAELPPESYAGGGTIYLCAVDADRMGVSLIQSNAVGFGARLVEPSTGVFLQNRGIGFSLEPGHPAELGPRRRPPHTLSPALVTDHSGRLDMVIGTMGGDAQPQVVLQLLARILAAAEPVGTAIAAPRWALSGRPPAGNGFDTWDARGPVQVHLEAESPDVWEAGLVERGHDVVRHPPLGYNVGHAHAIRVVGEALEGASDPRALIGAAIGY